jgi:hypothetical protein
MVTTFFTSPLKEVVLWICVTLKNPLSLAGFEPANLGSSGNHSNHLITKGDEVAYKFHNQFITLDEKCFE